MRSARACSRRLFASGTILRPRRHIVRLLRRNHRAHGRMPDALRCQFRSREDATMMHDGLLVSVLIPSYNRPEFLKSAVRSALAQTYTATEVLIQDNASDFDIETLVSEFKDPRVRYRRNEENLGMALNWRTLALRAKGKYLAFLNDDDI